MKPEDIQHGGNHYKDQPKHLQPIYLATTLKLNPMEYSVLKYLLRHRKKGGLLDLQKMMHFGQMLLQEEYGVETEIKYLGEPIDAEFEVVPESQPVTSDNPQDSPVCPWRFGDVIRTRGAGTDFDWTITEITPRGVECRTGSRGEISTFIPCASYKDYGLVKEVEADGSPACPFKVGDVVTHFDQNTSKTKWKITHIKDGKLLVTSYDPYQTPSWIEQVFWNNYRVVEQVETVAREPQPCPFKVGDVIQSIRWSDYIFRVYEIRGDIMEADSVTSGSRFEIPRDHWGGYRLKSDFSIDKPAATC
jgi:hypothetical protein